MKFWEKGIIAVITVVFAASLAWATGSFYWKDTFSGLDGLTDSDGDRGIVLTSGGYFSVYTNDGTGWTQAQLTGGIPVINKSTAYTIGTDDPVEAYGGMVRVTAAATMTLPAVVIGMNVCVYSTTAATVRVNPNNSDGIILNGATRATDGVDIYSDSTAGAFICLFGDSADGWTTLGRSGTWTEGS